MKKHGSGKTGRGSFYTHIMVRPGGIEGLGKADYRVERLANDQVMMPETMTHYLNSPRRKEFLINATKYYGKKVAA
jgi:hypothetical protein